MAETEPVKQINTQNNSNNQPATDTTGKYIINLSGKPLTRHATSLLDKGLGYAITNKKTYTYSSQIDPYIRRLRWKEYFRYNPTPSRERHPLAPPSNRVPPKATATYERYFTRMKGRILGLAPKEVSANLSRREQQTLSKLEKRKDIVINKADKGSCIVIEDTHTYIKNGRDHLANDKIYEPLDTDYTKTLTKRINETVNNSSLDTTTKNYLKLDEDKVRTQRMYFLKKIHKTPMGIRPIVSGCSGPTERISRVVDLVLKKSLDEIPSYIRDTKDFINTIEKLKVPREALLVTIDVTGLYLNIPQKEGIKRSLDKHYDYFPEEKGDRDKIASLMRIILEHNIFEFAGKMYRQKCGTAMGTKFAPTFANLFMDSVEQEFLAKCTRKPQTWKRYIDDIFMIWTHGREELKNFITHLNSHHPNLTFTWEAHEQQIDFLDAHIHKGKRFREEGILDISPFFKPTNKFQYTHFNSNHPRSTFRGLVKGEATRILRLSSDEETYKKTCQFLTKKFRERKYPHRMIAKTLNQVPYSHREDSLAEKPKKEWEEHKIPFVCPYQEHIEPHRLRQAIWTKEDGIIEEPVIAYQRCKSIGKHLTSSLAGTDKSRPRAALRLLSSFPTLT